MQRRPLESLTEASPPGRYDKIPAPMRVKFQAVKDALGNADFRMSKLQEAISRFAGSSSKTIEIKKAWADVMEWMDRISRTAEAAKREADSWLKATK